MVLHQALPPEAAAALPPGVVALNLALAGDSGLLKSLPVVEQGQVRKGPLEADGMLPPGTAASGCYRGGGTLVWRKSEDGPLPYPDWQALLETPPPGVEALVTVPVGSGGTLGAATFALAGDPSAAELSVLQDLGLCLGRTIAHQTKCLWEVRRGLPWRPALPRAPLSHRCCPIARPTPPCRRH